MMAVAAKQGVSDTPREVDLFALPFYLITKLLRHATLKMMLYTYLFYLLS